MAKHYPKPTYSKCNKGHELVEMYNEKYNTYDWDCPICKARMDKLGSFSHPKEKSKYPYGKKLDDEDITEGVDNITDGVMD